MFGKVTQLENITFKTFMEISVLKPYFEDKTVQLNDAEDWFKFNFLRISDTETHEKFDTTTLEANDELTDAILID